MAYDIEDIAVDGVYHGTVIKDTLYPVYFALWAMQVYSMNKRYCFRWFPILAHQICGPHSVKVQAVY